MATMTQDPWSEALAKSTLRQLHQDYPGYTPNELYAIWCHVNGEVPLDSDGKVIVERWVKQGLEDGERVDCGPFRVSRMLFGRAQRAEKGVPKPPRRKPQATPTPSPVTPPAATSGDLSPRAMEFAQGYDHAAQLINAIVLHRHEIVECVEELKQVRPSILQELAEASEEAGELLREVGAL